MMKAYTDGNIDLLIYQLIIGKNNIDKISNVFVLKGSGEKFGSQYFCDKGILKGNYAHISKFYFPQRL